MSPRPTSPRASNRPLAVVLLLALVIALVLIARPGETAAQVPGVPPITPPVTPITPGEPPAEPGNPNEDLQPAPGPPTGPDPVVRAAGKGQVDLSFADFLYGDAKGSKKVFKQTETLNADTIRVNLPWTVVAPSRPADPRDPADPGYNWVDYDRAVIGAVNRGYDVNLTVFLAPSWAEGPNRPADTQEFPPGSFRPDAAAFGDFAHALAVRYSGAYSEGGVELPFVRYMEAWNEPNLSTYITPQWNGKDNVASDIYSDLLNAFYTEVKAVNPAFKVVTGGMAPYGDPPGGPNRTRPERFLQEMLCLSPKNKETSCPNGNPSNFDIIAHHPINREDPPTVHADADGDIEVADFGELTKVLRTAERLGTPGTPGKHEIWANEIWWQTDPPDTVEGVPLKTHARWLSQAMYLLWKQGASNVTYLQFRDAKYTKGEFTLASYQTGIYTFDNKRKLSADALAFPFVTDRQGKGLEAWGVAPASGKLTIEADEPGPGGYRKVGSVKAKDGKVFTKQLRIKGEAKLRAKLGAETSVVWDQKN